MNNHHTLTDEKLIQFYLNGDPNAMGTLVELYKDRVYRSIYNIVQDKYAAEEIFKDVFICLINNMIAGKTAGDGNFLQWATRIAQNLCIEYSRKTNQPIFVNLSVEESVNVTEPATTANTGYYESHAKIKSLINLLPDDQREVMLLSHYGGLTFKEIAAVMKCSLNTALDSMKYGLKNLRKMMMEEEMAVS